MKYDEQFMTREVMTKEEQELLSQELCARLPYGVKLHNVTTKNDIELYAVDLNSLTASFWTFKGNSLRIGNISTIFRNDGSIRLKPYLRPMSSMTEEEKNEYALFYRAFSCSLYERESVERIDWLNAHHFDYRGLIPMGLALKATEGMYSV